MGCRPGTYLEWNRFGRWSRCFAVVLLTAALLPAGLLYGQDETTPQEAGQEAESPAAAEPAMAAGERVLELTLENAIQLALQNSLAIERERFAPLIARVDTDRAKVEFDPKVGAELTASETQELRTNQNPMFHPIMDSRTMLSAYLRHTVVTGGNYEIRFVTSQSDQQPDNAGFGRRIHNPLYENTLELTFTHPLCCRTSALPLTGRPFARPKSGSRLPSRASFRAILDTVFAVHRGYWELVFRIQDLAAKQQSQKLAEDFLAENTVRVELGTLAPIELVQAETRVKTREGDVIVAQSDLREADDRLKAILNIPESMGSWSVRLQPTDSPAFSADTTFAVEEQVDIAMRQRP